MKTTVGVDQDAYNRPETATTTYLPFRNYDFFFRSNYPFGVFQIGQAYRNEISPRKHLLRKREFTQAEAQLFILPEQKDGYEQYDDVKHTELPMWTWEQQDNGEPRETMRVDDVVGTLIDSEAYAWTLVVAYNLFREMGIPEERMRVRQHGPDEKAFYARDAWDIEIKTTSFGWAEVCGVHDRTDYDLSQHTEYGHETLETNQDGEKMTPHILEIAFGTDRPTFALLDIFYDYQEEEEGKTTFRVPYHMAPRKVAVFPLHRKDHLKQKAHDVHDMIKHEFNAKYDETASIGKRYLRASQEGIPYCVTVDYETVEEDPDTVTVRDRETEDQIRVEVDDLHGVLHNLFDGARLESQGDIV
jgi:glycyl-tRNA synthetase